MKYFLHSLLVICCLISFEAESARVNSITNSTPIDFGRISPGSATGSITSACIPTSVTIIGGCRNGSVSISATNTSSRGLVTVNDRKIKIFLTSPTTLTSGFFRSINSGAAIASIAAQTGCTLLSAGVLECTNPSAAVANLRNWTIPILGNLRNIATNQASGSYSSSYSVVACSCTVAGCPAATTDARCAQLGTLSSTIPARIFTPLSALESSPLRFGAIAAGATSGSVNQNGVVSGGVVALPSNGSNPRNAGVYRVTGERSTSYSFTFPAIITLSNGVGANMIANLSYASGGATRTLSASGTETVNINGTLLVGANQVPGVYNATYTITLNY